MGRERLLSPHCQNSDEPQGRQAIEELDLLPLMRGSWLLAMRSPLGFVLGPGPSAWVGATSFWQCAWCMGVFAAWHLYLLVELWTLLVQRGTQCLLKALRCSND